MALLRSVYKLTDHLPADEKFNLTSQMRRAATSVASNIAEGAARYSAHEKKHFFHIARGSLSELETQLKACISLYTISLPIKMETQVLIQRTWMLLQGLISSVAVAPVSAPRFPTPLISRLPLLTPSVLRPPYIASFVSRLRLSRRISCGFFCPGRAWAAAAPWIPWKTRGSAEPAGCPSRASKG